MGTLSDDCGQAPNTFDMVQFPEKKTAANRSRSSLVEPKAHQIGHRYEAYWPAREIAGRPDLRFHDLRHTGAVLAASTGASTNARSYSRGLPPPVLTAYLSRDYETEPESCSVDFWQHLLRWACADPTSFKRGNWTAPAGR